MSEIAVLNGGAGAEVERDWLALGVGESSEREKCEMGFGLLWGYEKEKLCLSAIYVPLGRKTPIGKPGWGSMLSVVDGGLTSIPWEDLDPTLVQAIQRESDGLALGDLKDRLRPQDAIETTPGGDEYVVTNTNALGQRRYILVSVAQSRRPAL